MPGRGGGSAARQGGSGKALALLTREMVQEPAGVAQMSKLAAAERALHRVVEQAVLAR
jgi:hypothetical protein